MHFDKQFDATGLACPLPMLKTKKTLSGMSAGEVLRVIATDPGSMRDIPAFAQQSGNAVLSSGEEAGKFVFLIRKG